MQISEEEATVRGDGDNVMSFFFADAVIGVKIDGDDIRPVF